jgi:hypothetical protein
MNFSAEFIEMAEHYLPVRRLAARSCGTTSMVFAEVGNAAGAGLLVRAAGVYY